MGKNTNQIAIFNDLQSIGYRIPLSSNINQCVTYNDLSVMNNETLLPFQTLQKSDWTYANSVENKLVKWSLIPGAATINLSNTQWTRVPSSYDDGPTVGIEFSVATTSQSQPFPSGTVLLIKVHMQVLLSSGSRSTDIYINLYSDNPTRIVYFPIGIDVEYIYITYETGTYVGTQAVNSVKASTLTMTNGNINLDGTSTYIISRNSISETYETYHDFVRNVFSIVFNLTL